MDRFGEFLHDLGLKHHARRDGAGGHLFANLESR
jgi:hypothetical protein